MNVWLALNVGAVYNFDGIAISIIVVEILTLELNKHKKISVVFDEGLQRICYNDLQDQAEIRFSFDFLQKPNLLRTRMANAGTTQQQ